MKKILDKKPASVCTDAGYYSLTDLAKVDGDIQLIVPSRKVMNQERGHKAGSFDKDSFTYHGKLSKTLAILSDPA